MTQDLDTTADALRAALREAADQVQVQPGMWSEPAARPEPRRGRRRRAPVAVAACVALLALGAAGAIVLARDRDGSSIETAASGIEVAPDELSSHRADLEVFMGADATHAEIADVREIVASLPGVERFAFLDKQDSLEEFRRIYASDPDLVKNITADALPTSFRILLRRSGTGARDRIQSRLASQHGVEGIATSDPQHNGGYQEPAGAPTSSVEIEALPTLNFDAKEYSVPAGIVEIVFRSAGGTHTLVIDDPRFEGFRLQSNGEPVSGTVKLTPGTYTIADAIPGHRDAGEEARLVVTAPVPQIERQVLASCTPTSASEGVAVGSGLGLRHGDVFADPTKGASGPLAVLLRYPGPPGQLPTSAPNTTVDGQPADYHAGEGGQSSISWLLSDGASASVHALDLSQQDAMSLAHAINVGDDDLPAGLAQIGTTTQTSWAISTCEDAQGLDQALQVIHGSRASRYGRLVAQPLGLRWESGDTTFLVTGPPGAIPSSPPEIRAASTSEWNQLLASNRARRHSP